MSNYSAPERLNPRDSLFGGRTNALKLYHKTAEGENVSYLDFTSLYPFVQSRKTYSIRHPEIILNRSSRILGLLNARCYHRISYCIRSSRSNHRRESCCSHCVANVQYNNSRSGVNTAMKKDQFQGFGHLWDSRMLSLKGIQLSKLWKSGTFRIRQTRCSGIM